MSPGADILMAGLWESIFSGFVPALLVLIGVVGILVGALSVYQTRKWPKHETPAKPEKKTVVRPDPPEPAKETATLRPTTTTRALQIRFPGIDASHPDVWAITPPLEVEVRADRRAHPASTALAVRLFVHSKGNATTIGTVALNEEGAARFEVPFDTMGEHDLVAELIADQRTTGQAVRTIRIVDYRSEVVETFEDFLAWAAGHYSFVDRKMTAREFVDRYADGRPGVPIDPLDRIVDLYELANYSDHPVDRRAYLAMVDAFLELEDAGALEGPEDS